MKTKLSLLLLTVIIISSILPLEIKAQVSQEWATSYNSPTNGMDNPVAMTTDNSGNIYVTGISPTSTTSKDYATVKYNSAGVQLWEARFNNTGNSSDVVKGICVDVAGNVYVTGSSQVVSSGVMITVKYNSAGEQQWAKQLGVLTATPASPGSKKNPIAVDGAGNVYVGGSRIFGSGQNSSYVLIKYNSNGDSLWSRWYKGSHFLAGLGNGISCIKIDGNFIYVTGKSFDQNPDLSASCFATTIKYDFAGAMQWMRKDTLASGSDEVTGMETDGSGNIIVVCNYGYDIKTFKFNSAGGLLWGKIYTGISGIYYDEVTGVAADPSGNIYLTGNSRRSTISGGEDFLTMKYDASGNLLWERFYNGTYGDGDYSKGITVDAAGNAYITGIAFDTNFDFNYATIKYDTDGTQKWKIIYDGGFTNRRDEPVAVCIDPNGNVIVTGISSRGVNTEDYTTIKYSQTVGINQLSSQIPDGFSLSQNYPNPFNPVTKILYALPNPDYVSLKIFDASGKAIAALVNQYQPSGTYEVMFDASVYTSGIYFYKLETGIFSETKKMLLIK